MPGSFGRIPTRNSKREERWGGHGKRTNVHIDLDFMTAQRRIGAFLKWKSE